MWSKKVLTVTPWEWVRARVTWQEGLFVLVTLVALGLRLWGLPERAIHHDEHLHIQYSWNLARGQGFSHNPLMHGPFQFLINALVFKLFWDSDFTARLGYAIGGAALVGLPYFLRRYLGFVPALVISIMLALSPTLLYFSRFSRNDIYMAFWAVLLLALMWRYLYEKKDRYLYAASATLALAYATKETAYILTLVLGAFLFLLSIPDLVAWLTRRIRLSQVGAPTAFLLLMISLVIPQWSALFSLFQGLLGITLVNDEAIVGMPEGIGVYWAIGIVGFTLAFSVFMGLMWRWRVWLICALIFYVIWMTLYTTYFTNLGGALTGVWQGMGYWMAQQDVARGGQPWYYYLVIGSVYDLLPMLFSLVAVFYYIRKGDILGIFLAFWSVLTFVVYTYAGEKMPWLMVNVSVPMLFLSGKFIGDLMVQVPWSRAIRSGTAVLVLVVPAVAFVGMLLLLRYLNDGKVVSWSAWALVGGVLILTLVWGLLFRLARPWLGLSLSALGVAALLLGFGTFVGFRASYSYDDSYKEMLVYAQFSADVRDAAMRLKTNILERTPVTQDKLVKVDEELRYAFEWYFRRNGSAVDYPCLKDITEYAPSPWCAPLDEIPIAESLLLTPSNAQRDFLYLMSFKKEGPYRHLLWFPEVYKGVTLEKLKVGLTSRHSWKKALDFLIFRKLNSDWLHSEFVMYQSRGGTIHP